MSYENCVAIVGMAGRFPGAATLEDYWNRIERGDDCITRLTPEDLGPEAGRVLATPGFVPAAGVVDGIELFDAALFRMSADEAALTDPQHRMFLECAWEALEDAGYGDVSALDGVAGVYAGSWTSSYAAHARGHVRDAKSELDALVAIGVDYLPMLASYRLDLRGESIAVQASCTTSLVAVHLGCQSLLTGQTDLVLAGAASVDPRQRRGYVHQPGYTLSPDGTCRPFSADAQGSVRGFGVGVVALRRVEDAIAAGDPIRAIIRGTAVTNDGRDRIGFAAPSVRGQANAIAGAIAMAQIDAGAIGFVEAHGTATLLGDAMEVEALTRAFGPDARGTSHLSAVKANVGHLSEAGGMASIIKTALALQHRLRPGLTHFLRPNPNIDFARSPFVISREAQPWPSSAPRLASVNGYGVGGTNAHVVLEEAPPAAAGSPAQGPWVFALSAATADALRGRRRQLHAWLGGDRDVDLADLAYTLAVGRRPLDVRLAIVADSADRLRTALDSDAAPLIDAGSTPSPTLTSSAERWLAGDRLSGDAVPPTGRRLRLPTYPFDRRRHWLEPVATDRHHGLAWWLDAPRS